MHNFHPNQPQFRNEHAVVRVSAAICRGCSGMWRARILRAEKIGVT